MLYMVAFIVMLIFFSQYHMVYCLTVAEIGIPEVDRPTMFPIVMFHPKCHPIANPRFPVTIRLIPAVNPPTKMLSMLISLFPPGDPRCITTKKMACNPTPFTAAQVHFTQRVYTLFSVRIDTKMANVISRTIMYKDSRYGLRHSTSLQPDPARDRVHGGDPPKVT